MASERTHEQKKPMGMYEKQKRVTIVLMILIVLLAIGAAVSIYLVNLDRSSFEQGGVVYRVQERDGKYVLTNDQGYVCEKTADGYFVTDDGKVMVKVDDTGSYKIYAAVEDLEDGESVSNLVAQTILIFPYVSQTNLQTLEMHNEHGTYTFYKDSYGNFRVKGTEDHLASYDPTLFASLTSSTCNMIAQEKIKEPIVDANGAYSEYGLADSDTYWYITTSRDEVYKIVLGDKTPTDSGYYVQYVACKDPVLNKDGSVASATETPRMAVYIVAPTVMNPSTTTGSIETLEKPFHEPIESLMMPQIVYEVSLSTYFDVQNFIIMHGDESFLAFDYIDIAKRAHTERSSDPFIMLLTEHKGFKASANNIMNALECFYGMTFMGCVKLNPTEEDLVKYGIYVDPVPSFTEEKTKDEVWIYYVLRSEDGRYVLCDGDKNPMTPDESGNYTTSGGAVLHVDAESGAYETVSGEGIWEKSYSSPYSIYYNFDVTKNGSTYTTEQLVHVSLRSENDTFYAYSPNYGMIVEIAPYELDFLEWNFFSWIETGLFEINIAFMDYVRLDLPGGSYHHFDLNNEDSKQGTVQKLSEQKYKDAAGNVYTRRRGENGDYGLYKSSGPEHTVSMTAYFRLDDKTANSTNFYISYTGMPSGGKTEGWFKAKLYLTSDNKILLCDAENDSKTGYLGVATVSTASSALKIVHNEKDTVDVSNFRQFYQTIAYASIQQEHPLTAEEEAALIADADAFQLRLHMKSADQDLVYEFYYLTSRKSYIRISGDGGETFSGGMYVLTSRVSKIISDAEKVLAGVPVDPTAKN